MINSKDNYKCVGATGDLGLDSGNMSLEDSF